MWRLVGFENSPSRKHHEVQFKGRELFVVCFGLFSAAMASGQTRSKVCPPHAAAPLLAGSRSHVADAQPAVNPAGPTWTKATRSARLRRSHAAAHGRPRARRSEPDCSGCTGKYSNSYTLAPDDTGSYVNGTWTQVASAPSGYAPLFFGSAVLKDGKVVIQGGESDCNPSCSRYGRPRMQSMIQLPIPGPLPRRRPRATLVTRDGSFP